MAHRHLLLLATIGTRNKCRASNNQAAGRSRHIPLCIDIIMLCAHVSCIQFSHFQICKYQQTVPSHCLRQGDRATGPSCFSAAAQIACNYIVYFRQIFGLLNLTLCKASLVTICTAQWSLYVPHSGHYMYRTVVTICTASLTYTNSTFCPTHCIYVFCVDLRTNSHYFPIRH